MRGIRRQLVTAFVTLGLVSCSGSPTSPSGMGAPLSQKLSTAHFDFQWSEGDNINTEWQEAFHDWMIREFQITVDRRISYSKYTSPQHMLQLHYGPGNVNAWADPDLFTLHTIWPFDNHEVIHLYASTFGRATLLLNEGLAVAYQMDPVRGDMTPRWNNRHIHDVSAGWRRQGRLMALSQMLTIPQFQAMDSQVAYPEAGSFVRFLIDAEGGIPPIKALFGRSTHQDPADVTRGNIEAVYGKPLEALEAEWLAMLDAR